MRKISNAMFEHRTKMPLELQCLSIGSLKQTNVIRLYMLPLFGIHLPHWEWNASRTEIPCRLRIEFEWDGIDFRINYSTVEMASAMVEIGEWWSYQGSKKASKQSCKSTLYRYSRVNSSIQGELQRVNVFHFQHSIISERKTVPKYILIQN